jgi:hypothetical protein
LVQLVKVGLVLFLHWQLFVRFGQTAHVVLQMWLAAEEKL